ncbi:MAG: AsmA family protein [Burkholderiaceae bacterium]
MLPPQTPRLTDPDRRRRFRLAIAILIGVPLCAVAIAVGLAALVTLSGMTIDASRWRDAAAQRASAALGRPVILQGALELEPSLSREVGVRVGALRILSPDGFAAPEFLAIGELRARIDLFDALRGRLRSRSIEARDVNLWLERGADGGGNWTGPPQSEPGARQPEIDIDRIVLHGLDIHYHDTRSATRRAIELEELSGSAGLDRPLRIAARGGPEPRLAYSVRIEGGPLRLLHDGAEPWPITIDVETHGARLHARGALDARQHTARFDVDGQAEDLALLDRLVGSPLPHLGKASVQCMVSFATDSLHLSDLRGALGESEFSGQLTLAFGGPRPRLSGALSAATLDLRPFLAARQQAQGQEDANHTPARESLYLRDLAAFDAEVELKVEQGLGLGVDIRDASFALRVDRRGLRVPIGATIAGVPVAGGLELDTLAATPTLAVQLAADNAVLGKSAHGAGLASGVEGTVGHLRLRMNGRGETLASLARDLEFSLVLMAARLRFGGATGGGHVAASLDKLALAARRGDRLRGHAHGALQGQRGTLNFRGGTVPDMMRERVLPLEVDLALAHARLQVQGTLPFAASAGDTALRFDLQVRRAGDLAAWLSVAPQSTLPVALRGQLRVSDNDWALDTTTLAIGRSQLTIEARRAAVAGRPDIVASVRGTLIDAHELSTLRASGADSRVDPRGPAPASAAIDLADADVDFTLQRLRLGRTDLEDLAFVARTRNGRLLPASVTGTVAGAPFAANVELDLRAQPPTASLDLFAGAIDIGTLLRGLGVVNDIDGRAEALQVHLRGRGGNLSEWVGHSAIDVRAVGGSLTVRGAAQGTVAEMRVDEARIGALAGGPVRARLAGAIGETPVTLEVTSGTLADLAGDASRLPVALTARAAGAVLTLDGEVSLPLGSGGQLSLEMRGEQLDSLSDLARVELPVWGPWSLSSAIRMTSGGYELQSLHLGVGHSQLSGSAKLDLGKPRPYLELQLAAPSVQLDDFPLTQRPSESPARDDRRGLRDVARRTVGHTDKLLSAAFLRRLDATIDVKAKQVLSGDDRLADGALRVRLDGGHLYLDPAVVNLPGGAIQLSVSYNPKETEVELAVAASVERFDYGIIARRLDRTDDLRGLFSVNLEFVGTAPSLETIMRSASGKVDFAVWPTELRSGIFKLWSVNLLLELLPLIDPDTRPKVNCIVGRFDLEHGDLRDDKMLIDTSAVRIRGAGHANLATEELDFTFRPRAKGFALFRLQTPLRVTGTLGDQRFGFTRIDVVESMLRLIASPILLPIERLTLGPLPRDGADVCTDPLRSMAR